MTMTDLSGWRGHDVVDPSGDKIGEIEDIYLDEQTDQLEWLAVRTGLYGRRVSFVPLAEAQPSGDYVAVLGRLARLRPQVDAFFDQVMVNVDDPAVRGNRLALLQRLADRLGSVAAIEHLSA